MQDVDLKAGGQVTTVFASAELVHARASFERSMAETRELLFRSPQMRPTHGVRAQAENYLEQVRVVAYNLGIVARQSYPRFQVDTLFGPTLFSIWGPNPDFVYGWAALDGAHSYRITGRRNDSVWGSLQVSSGFWGEPGQRNMAELPFDDMTMEPDGTFEVFLGVNRRGKNWIPLDGTNPHNYVFLRRTVIDWQRDVPAQAHIELLDTPNVPFTFTESELARRIDRAGKLLRDATAVYTIGLVQHAYDQVGANKFHCVSGSVKQDEGYNPGAAYFHAVYELAADDALVIEADPQDAKYWGIHLTDIWLQTLDYVHHQSCLNAAQAVRDEDGKYRFVLSLHDPGVPNWLDPLDSPVGMVQFRSYYATKPAVLTARVIELKDVRQHVHRQTPVISPESRKQIVQARARAILRHYGA